MADFRRLSERTANQRFIEPTAMILLMVKLPQMPENDSLSVNFRHRFGGIDSASREKQPQIRPSPYRFQFRLGSLSAVARMVHRPISHPDFKCGGEIDQPIVVIDQRSADFHISDSGNRFSARIALETEKKLDTTGFSSSAIFRQNPARQ